MFVKNMISSSGREVANQFIINDSGEANKGKGTYFQSYRSIIAFIPCESWNKTMLDETYWNYSRTTSKYRNLFLNETTKETEKKIASGEYILTNLN